MNNWGFRSYSVTYQSYTRTHLWEVTSSTHALMFLAWAYQLSDLCISAKLKQLVHMTITQWVTHSSGRRPWSKVQVNKVYCWLQLMIIHKAAQLCGLKSRQWNKKKKKHMNRLQNKGFNQASEQTPSSSTRVQNVHAAYHAEQNTDNTFIAVLVKPFNYNCKKL